MPKKTSNNNDKRLEILGVLFLAISTFVTISILGHDTNEELSISPNVQINNPMGVLGLLISHVLIKLTLDIILLLPTNSPFFKSVIQPNPALKGSIFKLRSLP